MRIFGREQSIAVAPTDITQLPPDPNAWLAEVRPFHVETAQDVRRKWKEFNKEARKAVPQRLRSKVKAVEGKLEKEVKGSFFTYEEVYTDDVLFSKYNPARDGWYYVAITLEGYIPGLGKSDDKKYRNARCRILPARQEEGESNECHYNVAKLRQADLIDSILTGYAMDLHGIWVRHSWGMKSNVIVETTRARLVYFGVTLDGEAEDLFMKMHANPPDNADNAMYGGDEGSA